MDSKVFYRILTFLFISFLFGVLVGSIATLLITSPSDISYILFIGIVVGLLFLIIGYHANPIIKSYNTKLIDGENTVKTSLMKKKIYCIKCGEQIPDDSAFCIYCGNKQISEG
jgi:xanthosine utilization system XapX-like protein